MNPATTEATSRAIERYLNPGKEPLNTPGMVGGRIVQLAGQEEGHRPEIRRVSENQPGILMPLEIDGPIRERMIKNTPNTDVQTPGNYQERIRWNRQIRNRLTALKADYADKFVAMNERTSTTFDRFGQIITGGNGVLEDGTRWNYSFCNVFTRTHWEFRHNYKRGKVDTRDLHMSNVIAHQFEWAFHYNGWLLELPTTIKRCGISNTHTIEVLRQHKLDYRNDDFRKAFLETTVNGKSTIRVAQDLGLTIDCLDVFYDSKPVERIDEEIDISQALGRFDVHIQVSPDLAVYRG